LDNLIGNLTRPTIGECFNAYAEEFKLASRWKVVFQRIKKLRDATAHSKVRTATADDVLDAQSLLRLMIKREFFVVGTLPSEVFPGHLHRIISWTEEGGWVSTGQVNWLDRIDTARTDDLNERQHRES
jgi:hypothetical protein